MILDVLGGLVVADALAAALFATAVYIAGRRSGHPVSAAKAGGLAGCLTTPAVLLYGIAWLWLKWV